MHRTNFCSTIRTRKIKLSKDVLRSGNGGVAAKLCLDDPIWPPLPKEGVIQWWGRLTIDWEFSKFCDCRCSVLSEHPKSLASFEL